MGMNDTVRSGGTLTGIRSVNVFREISLDGSKPSLVPVSLKVGTVSELGVKIFFEHGGRVVKDLCGYTYRPMPLKFLPPVGLDTSHIDKNNRYNVAEDILDYMREYSINKDSSLSVKCSLSIKHTVVSLAIAPKKGFYYGEFDYAAIPAGCYMSEAARNLHKNGCTEDELRAHGFESFYDLMVRTDPEEHHKKVVWSSDIEDNTQAIEDYYQTYIKPLENAAISPDSLC